jgi:hypothetical protein
VIPQGGIGSSQSTQTQQQPSRTYGIDFTTGRIIGMIDSLEALKQAVFKILSTERFAYVLYNQSYGVEFSSVGKSPAIVGTNMVKAIRDALLQDDRISDVQDIQITFDGDEATATFTVISIFGSFQASQGV